ncbi:MAG TPA: hypothetical protein VNJ01_00975 [Bacteriovoracaceae bacterium]|nr:hypothetical protein [Bacteriovoracaceae bacterium]
MMRLRPFIISVLLTLFLVGCSKGPSAKTKIIVSVAALTSGQAYAGGILLHVVDPLTKKLMVFDLSQTDSVSIPYGTWDFFLVGYNGNVSWQGNTVCGSSKNTTLSSVEATVTITVDDSDCTGAEFASMMENKAKEVAGNWDTTNFDQSAWGP